MANVDLEAAQRLVEQLQCDLAAARAGHGDPAALRAEVDELRALLDRGDAPMADVHAGLTKMRERLHALSDELVTDAVKSGDYLARIGRLLGL